MADESIPPIADNVTLLRPFERANAGAEIAVLCRLMVDCRKIDEFDFLKPTHFAAHHWHPKLWACARELADSGTRTYVDPVELANAFANQTGNDVGEVHEYLMHCMDEMRHTQVNSPGYAHIVRDRAVRREVSALGRQIAQTGEAEHFLPLIADLVHRPDAKAKAFAPSVFELPDARDIPRRQFVGGNHSFPRGVVATIVGTGGSAKSSMTIVEALALATGLKLLHAPAGDPAVVWMLNCEDPMHELQRRIVAAAQHYGITQAMIGGRLFVNSGMDSEPFITAEMSPEGTLIHWPVMRTISDHIRRHRIEAMFVDPYVSTHRVAENDNGAMDAVIKAWARVAHDTNCCITLVHHLRKLMGRDASAEDARGGSSMIGAVRLARVVNPLSKEDAERSGIETDVWRHFAVTDGKANLSPRSDKAKWFRLESVELANGDSVGVVTAWQRPNAFDDITVNDLKRVMAAVSVGEWKLDSRGKGQWVGKLVGDICDIDITQPAGRAQVIEMVRTWIERGVLRIQKRKDANRNLRDFVVSGELADGDEK